MRRMGDGRADIGGVRDLQLISVGRRARRQRIAQTFSSCFASLTFGTAFGLVFDIAVGHVFALLVCAFPPVFAASPALKVWHFRFSVASLFVQFLLFPSAQRRASSASTPVNTNV